MNNKKCIGCGRVLQNNNSSILGYVKNLDNDYCLRCFRIRNYNDSITISTTNEEEKFENNLSKLIIENKKTRRFFYVLDIFNFDASRISWVEKILSENDTTIVVNKIDLLPRAMSFEKIISFVEDIFVNTNLQEAEIVLFSSIKKWGIDELFESISEQKENYFIGKTNVGKSSIINSILKFKKETPKIVESYFLNTTIDNISIIYDDFEIVDTPGIAEKNSFANMIDNKEIKYLYFKKEIKQLSFKIDNKQSFVFGSILTINFNLVDERNLVFYVNPDIDFHRTRYDNANNYVQKNQFINHPIINDNLDFVEKQVLYYNQFINKKVDLFIQELGWVCFFLKKGDEISYTISNPKINPLIEFRNSII